MTVQEYHVTSSTTAAPAGAEQPDQPPVESARCSDALTVVPARNPWHWRALRWWSWCWLVSGGHRSPTRDGSGTWLVNG